MSNINKKIIVIVGTTASGKTTAAVKLACDFNGEIVSADSRQVYKYMDIGTGKDLNEYQISVKGQMSKVKCIKHHLIDVVEPNEEYNLARFYNDANQAIGDITDRHKLPIAAGGSGLYAQALVDGYELSSVKPDEKLRAELEKLNVEELYERLSGLNKKFADKLHPSDQKNKRRLIRYIEIYSQTDHPATSVQKPDYESLVIGLTWPRDVLRKRIYKRLIERLEKENMIQEVEDLHAKHGVDWKRIKSFGLEYKFIAKHLLGEIDYDEMVESLNRAIAQFAKRQMTWLRRWERQGQKIHWLTDYKDIKEKVKEFIV